MLHHSLYISKGEQKQMCHQITTEKNYPMGNKKIRVTRSPQMSTIQGGTRKYVSPDHHRKELSNGEQENTCHLITTEENYPMGNKEIRVTRSPQKRTIQWGAKKDVSLDYHILGLSNGEEEKMCHQITADLITK